MEPMLLVCWVLCIYLINRSETDGPKSDIQSSLRLLVYLSTLEGVTT